ncbi:MAG TPA: nuclear transport factor 2 family protein [Gaiellaceae bacterium]|nr:nuclear transport factor 2 family protein [Gaiellaceae bacterium]
MTANADVVRRRYAARAAGDFDGVARLLADDVAWHEPGQFDYSGHHSGKDAALALLRRLAAATGDTFTLAPGEVVTTREYAVTIVRWSAERDGKRAEGDEVAVYRLHGGQVSEAWCFPEISDAAEHDAVFTLAGTELR